MFTHVAHFDRKVGIYIATKLFQFASCKEPYAILAGPDGFFRPCSSHRVRSSYGDFLNSFAMKARAGPYGSYDNISFSVSSTFRFFYWRWSRCRKRSHKLDRIGIGNITKVQFSSKRPHFVVDVYLKTTRLDKDGTTVHGCPFD